MRSILLFVAGLLLSCSVGCATCDLVEAELRYQTHRAEELQSRLDYQEAELTVLRESVRQQDPGLQPGPSRLPPQVDAPYSSVVSIKLMPQTGLRDVDRDGCEDALQVLVSPQDSVGDAVKIPGRIAIELYDFLPGGEMRLVQEWRYFENEIIGQWKSSIMGGGYQWLIPWRSLPESGRLRVIVRLTTIQGRTFVAEKDLLVANPERQPVKPAAPPITLPPATKTSYGRPTMLLGPTSRH